MSSDHLLAGSDVAAIARERDGWLAAMNSDNLQGVVTPLTENCWAFPPHEAPLQGMEAQRAWHKGRIAQFTTRISMSSDELIGAGDFAIDRLSYAIALTPRTGGPAIQDEGTCFWIWQRDPSGSWKIARAIWNSANPVASAV
jgi:ketosteroid isomerase-like protein